MSTHSPRPTEAPEDLDAAGRGRPIGSDPAPASPDAGHVGRPAPGPAAFRVIRLGAGFPLLAGRTGPATA